MTVTRDQLVAAFPKLDLPTVGGYGADRTGATDATAAWTNALAASPIVGVEPGTYMLADLALPSTADCALVPLGPVTIKWPGTATLGAMHFSCLTEGTHISAEIDVTAVTQKDATFPSSNKQYNAKLTGSAGAFSALALGDLVHIQSDDTDAKGFIQAEYGEVAGTADAGATLFLTRPTTHDYAGATTIKLRRVLSTPKIMVPRGFTFTPSVDSTQDGISRQRGILLRGAVVDPDIDVAFNGAYGVCIDLLGVVRGSIRLRARDLHVKYGENAFGYGVQSRGSCYQTSLDIEVRRGGHAHAPNGLGTTYSANDWYQRGTPIGMEIDRLVETEGSRSAWDSHWSYHPRTHYMRVEGSTQHALETNNNSQGIGGAAIDPWYGRVELKDVYRAIYVSSHSGATSRWQIDELIIDNDQPTPRPIVAYEGEASANNVTVEIRGGYSRMSTGQHLGGTLNSAVVGPEIVARNFTFKGGAQIGRLQYDNANRWRLMDCEWEPDPSTATNSCFLVDSDCSNSQVIVDGLRVIQDSDDDPDGVFCLLTGADVQALVNRAVCIQNASTPMTLYSSDSDGGATITPIASSRVDTNVALSDGTTGGSGSAGAGNQYVEQDINGTVYKVLHDGTV